LLSEGLDPLWKLCITLAKVGLPFCSTTTTSLAAPFAPPFAELSLFFCNDRLIAANAASLRGFPLGVSREDEAFDGVLELAGAFADFARLFLSENLGNEDGTEGFVLCCGIVDVLGAVQR
jgi:hypothetical protein